MTQMPDAAPRAEVSSPAPATIDDRYGRSRQRGIDTRIGWALAGAAVLAGLIFLAFGGWQETSRVEYRDLAYSVEGQREVRVDFEVTAPAGAPVACTIEALSPSYATVGWKVIELEPSDTRTRRFSETLVTTYEATTGVVRSCWIVEESA